MHLLSDLRITLLDPPLGSASVRCRRFGRGSEQRRGFWIWLGFRFQFLSRFGEARRWLQFTDGFTRRHLDNDDGGFDNVLTQPPFGRFRIN